MFEHSEQASPIFVGVAEIRINTHLAREIILQHNTRQLWRHHEWPPFAMTIKESGRVLPCPSVVFHMITNGHPWVAHTLSHCTSIKWGKVLSNSATVEATKFTGPHKSRMRQYIINACSSVPNWCTPWSTQAGATMFRAPNIKADHSHPSHMVFSTFS
jgi:hypothetical protein